MHALVFRLHSVKLAYIERENICIHVYPQIFFLARLVSFYFFPTSYNFPQKLFFPIFFFVFTIFTGGESFLKPILFIGGVASIFYRAEFFCIPLILYFLLTFVMYVYYLPFDWIVFVNTLTKGGEIDEILERFLIVFI